MDPAFMRYPPSAIAIGGGIINSISILCGIHQNIIAICGGITNGVSALCGSTLRQTVIFQLFAQGGAIHAQHFCGAALVAIAVTHHFVQ